MVGFNKFRGVSFENIVFSTNHLGFIRFPKWKNLGFMTPNFTRKLLKAFQFNSISSVDI